jgi:hypothetical protein
MSDLAAQTDEVTLERPIRAHAHALAPTTVSGELESRANSATAAEQPESRSDDVGTASENSPTLGRLSADSAEALRQLASTDNPANQTFVTFRKPSVEVVTDSSSAGNRPLVSSLEFERQNRKPRAKPRITSRMSVAITMANEDPPSDTWRVRIGKLELGKRELLWLAGATLLLAVVAFLLVV